MGLQGKGFFIWKIQRVEGGDVQAIAEMAVRAQLSHVLFKIADGTRTYNIVQGHDLARALADALHQRGVQAWGWHYVYGDDPVGEANIAIQRVQELDLDGYVIDAEAQYKAPGKDVAARKFMSTLRNGLPDTPVALSSYRYPSYHPQLPWREFLEKCDYNMPQVYWMFATNPDAQLARCVREFQNLAPFRPIIPTGAAFTEHGWQPSPAEVKRFLDAARQLNLSAANFWEWYDARHIPNMWATIRDYPWPLAGGPPQDIVERLLAAWNTRDPDQVVGLYTDNAVHITAARTVLGKASIRAWYQSLFDTILPNAQFTLTGYSGTGNSRHFTWSATSSAGTVSNGNDTLGLMNGQIGYHYTFFTVE